MTETSVVTPLGIVFSVDTEQRVIRGLAVPFGVEGVKAGQRFVFGKGSVRFADPKRVKLYVHHDKAQAVGVAFELTETDEGLEAAFKVARGPRGDEALSMAEDGVWDGLSLGPSEGSKFQTRDGVHHAVDVPIHEISLTPQPVFGEARVKSVAFDAGKEPVMGEENTETPEAPTFEAITDAIRAGFATLTEGERPAIVPAGAPTFEVDESPVYRFDGGEGEHDFSADLIAFGRDRDSEAGERVMTFIQEQFAVTTGNVSTLNPTRQRPDLYVDERRFATPLLDRLRKGSIDSMTPFIVPKFNSATGLVAPHVEGVEPTPGGMTATSQTITPGAVSGKVEITREVWDQGGNPQVSAMLWTKMQQHYNAAMEARAVALLNAASPQGITITTAAENAALVSPVEQAIVDLNFVAGGNTFNLAATHANLYRRLAAAVDTGGRKLLPIYGPANANGQARSKFTSLDVAGTEFLPVPSLGVADANSSKSYLVDTDAVHVWASAPQRLQFEYRVAFIDLGIWGYAATAITDLAGLRVINYDPTA